MVSWIRQPVYMSGFRIGGVMWIQVSVWWFYVQFGFWADRREVAKFSFWLIEKSQRKRSRHVRSRGLCISKMSIASWCWSGNVALRLEWQFRTNQRSDIARAESSKFGAVRAESDIQVGRVWSRVRYYYCVHLIDLGPRLASACFAPSYIYQKIYCSLEIEFLAKPRAARNAEYYKSIARSRFT